MKIRCLLLIYLLNTLWFTACSRRNYYIPNTLHIPALRARHDAQVSAGAHLNNPETGYEFKGAYSPVKYMAIMVNHLNVQRGNRNKVGDAWSQLLLTEGALGGYYPVYPFTFSLFTGYGEGFSENNFPNINTSPSADLRARLNMQRWFFQGNVALRTRFFNFGLGFRMSRLNFNSANVDLQIEPDELNAIKLIEQQKPFFLPEYGINLGWRIRPVVVTWDVVTVVGNRYDLEALHLAGGGICLTVNLELNYFWKKNDDALKWF